MAREVEVVEGEVGRAQDATRASLEVGGNAEPDGGDPVVEHDLDGRVDGGEHVLLRRPRALHLVRALDHPVPVDDTGEDLGAAHVDSDDEGRSHGRRLP